MKKTLFTLALLISFVSFGQIGEPIVDLISDLITTPSKNNTVGEYIQGKNYKAVHLTGYGTNVSGGYDTPSLRLNKFDKGNVNLYLKDIFPFEKDENLEVIFIFQDEEKNKEWKVTRSSFGCQNEKYPSFFECFFVNEITNISTGEILDSNIKIAEKLISSNELVIKVGDDYSKEEDDSNVCRFKLKKFKKRFKKVLSSKYFSKDEELMN